MAKGVPTSTDAKIELPAAMAQSLCVRDGARRLGLSICSADGAVRFMKRYSCVWLLAQGAVAAV